MTIAQKLIAARGGKSRGIVAKDLGISLSALSMYERGERVPRDEIKVRISAYYSISVQALFYSPNSHIS